MGIYVNPTRWLGFRVTRRGIRVKAGPRLLRFHFGAGGRGVSTGAGPVSLYRALGWRHRHGR